MSQRSPQPKSVLKNIMFMPTTALRSSFIRTTTNITLWQHQTSSCWSPLWLWQGMLRRDAAAQPSSGQHLSTTAL